ncbi:hypothetical protein AUJ84_00355 [Candidatus Pacearchaeota archaeon CG1_02_32_132]|nr:MAG: hypothetical protein AUJ84_00355 [Candidatus Pacearchaeota archaeon CG1_02_32_132]
MRQDIYGGLKNAVEKGDDLESAVRSFINAGYPEAEVRDAAQALSGSTAGHSIVSQTTVSSTVPQTISHSTGTKSPENRQQVQSNLVRSIETDRRKGTDWGLIVLGSVLFILIIVLITSIFFKTQIIDFFSSLI